MSATTTNTTETAPTSAEEALAAVERSRTTVRRVLEYVRGERPAGDVRPKDWFAAAEYVRDETDVEITLYYEFETEGRARATIKALCDARSTLLIAAGWSRRSGYGAKRTSRRDVEEGFRFWLETDTGPEILLLDEAKDRAEAWALEHGGEEAGW